MVLPLGYIYFRSQVDDAPTKFTKTVKLYEQTMWTLPRNGTGRNESKRTWGEGRGTIAEPVYQSGSQLNTWRSLLETSGQETSDLTA